jgi:hypothetical protein
MVHNGTYSSQLKLLLPETQKNCDSCIATGRGAGKQLQWIGEKMKFLHTSMLVS